MTAVRYLGTSDDVTTCDCCGRKDLKSTVALSIDDADPVYFGVVCAAKALRARGFMTDTQAVRTAAKAADNAKRAAEMAARAAEQHEATLRWFAWLDAKVPAMRGEAFRQIQSLGGYTAARAMYEAG